MTVKEQIRLLGQLAKADNALAPREQKLIESIGKANGLDQAEIEDAINTSEQLKENYHLLSTEQRFEYLYNVIQIMKIDGEVYKSEIAFCQDLAAKLGYKKKVVGELSKYIFSDPSITSDRQKLIDLAAKYSV